MSAPALILLGQGGTDSRIEQVYHTLRHHLQSQRPALSIHLAFASSCSPKCSQVVGTLAKRGIREAVVVPVDLSRVHGADDQMSAALSAAASLYPEVRVMMSQPLGPAVELLSLLDMRIRNALTNVRATELDGLVLLTASRGDTRGAGLLGRRARQWSAHHKLPVFLAHADGSGPDVVAAISSLRQMGRRSIAIGATFISATEDYRRHAELALSAGALAVSAPIGADPCIAELVMARYSFAAMDLLDDSFAAEADDVCDQDQLSQVL